MKIRLEGTQKEIDHFLFFGFNAHAEVRIKSVSKFYPKREKLSVYPFSKKSEIGRVYVEVE